MTTSDDRKVPDGVPDAHSTQPAPAEKTTAPGGITRASHAAQLAGKALPYLAALAAAGAAQPAAAAPPNEQDRAYLEALLHGSWTQPPDLTARRLPSGSEAGRDKVADESADAGYFNDSFNPNPKPYSDRLYSDTAFGDRTR